MSTARALAFPLLFTLLHAQPQPFPAESIPPPPPVAGPPTWPATSPIGAPTTFEVATVKPNVSGGFSRMEPSAGRLKLTNYTLAEMITWAWRLKPYQLANLPSWTTKERFDIDAKAYGAPDFGHLQLLLQPLLKERFGLLLHTETRVVPVYFLKSEQRSKLRSPTTPARLGWHSNSQRAEVTARSASLDLLANAFSRILGRPVVDQTGLSGLWDFDLTWAPSEEEIARSLPFPSAPDPNGVSVFTSVKEQLGLRLESGRGPGEVLVIDSAEKPTGN